MSIIRKITTHFNKTKECLFCESKLELNKKHVVFYLQYDPRYCNNCHIDYCDSKDNDKLNLRIIIGKFLFVINGHDMCVHLNNKYLKHLNIKEINNIINANTKQELYSILNNIIKVHIFS